MRKSAENEPNELFSFSIKSMRTFQLSARSMHTSKMILSRKIILTILPILIIMAFVVFYLTVIVTKIAAAFKSNITIH